MGGLEISNTQVSRCAALLNEELAQWRQTMISMLSIKGENDILPLAMRHQCNCIAINRASREEQRIATVKDTAMSRQ